MLSERILSVMAMWNMHSLTERENTEPRFKRYFSEHVWVTRRDKARKKETTCRLNQYSLVVPFQLDSEHTLHCKHSQGHSWHKHWETHMEDARLKTDPADSDAVQSEDHQ